MKVSYYILFSVLALFLTNCSDSPNNRKTASQNDLASNDYLKDNSMSETTVQFAEYWYSGKAELTRYDLSQSRYGEIHKGEAVLIFVTEDFLKDKQVKFEGSEKTDKVTSILKLNSTKKFFTGIYPYSMMTSVFTPVNLNDKTLKISTTSQEWCGHTFSQINLNGRDYKYQLYSYFMNEGDVIKDLDASHLEDAIWTTLRIDPSALPIGTIKMIPGTQFLRLKHRELAVENATAALEDFKDSTLSDNSLKKYSVNYNDFERNLTIIFEADFPHTILKWTEDGDNNKQGKLTTIAIRTKTIKEPYWGMNSVADSTAAKEFGVRK